jgi:hypothetical protein
MPPIDAMPWSIQAVGPGRRVRAHIGQTQEKIKSGKIKSARAR